MPGSSSIGMLSMRLAEAHDVEDDHPLVVGVVVQDLQAAHLVDALADGRQRQRQPVVGEPGVDAVDEQRDAAREGRLLHALGHLERRARRVLEEHRAAGDDVDAGLQQALEVVDRLEQPVVGHRAVDDAVRLQRDDLRRRRSWRARRGRGRGRPARRRPGRPCRGWRPRAPTSSRSGRASMPDEGVLAHVAGAPGDDANGHRSSSPRSGSAMSRLGWSMPPSTSTTLPVM